MLDLNIDFGRSINPAFSIPSPSLSSGAQKNLNNFLPIINAVTPLHSALSYAFLAIHLKDFSLECYEGLSGNKSWDELQPQMLSSAKAVCHLVLSVQFPVLHLIGSEYLGLVSIITNFDKNNQVFSITQFGLQFLYLFSMMSKLPYFKALLADARLAVLSENGKSGLKDEEWVRNHASDIFKTQILLGYLNLLPLLFRNITDLKQYPTTISLLAIVGRIYQAIAFIFSNVSEPHSTLSEKLNSLNVIFPLVERSTLSEILKEITRVNIINKIQTLASLAFLLGSLYKLWVDGVFGGRSFVVSNGKPVKMDDVIGCVSAKESMSKIVDQIKHPENYSILGPVQPLKGMLFFGPPGTGKSMLAKAFATEVDTNLFLACEGSAFVNKYVGTGPEAVRLLFSQAAKLAKKNPEKLVVIFIDEINAIGEKRSAADTGAQREHNNTTEAFLVAIDDSPSNVVVIGATNTDPKELDPAFTRSGRFDRHIKFEIPSSEDRKAILIKTSAAYKLSDTIDDAFWKKIVSQTDQWNFADLDNLVKQAATSAGFKRLSEITPEIIEETLETLKREKSTATLSYFA